MNKKILRIILICAAVVLIGAIVFAVLNSMSVQFPSYDDEPYRIEDGEDYSHEETYQESDIDSVSDETDNAATSQDEPANNAAEPPAATTPEQGAVAADAAESPHVPVINVSIRGTDGDIIPNIQVPYLGGGMTVYHALTLAAGFRQIDVRTRGSGRNVYVAAIDGLAEFDRGPMSGWVYYVNGERASVGAGAFEVSDGDTILWRFTTDGR